MAEGEKGKGHYLYTVCDKHIWRVFLGKKKRGEMVLLEDVKKILIHPNNKSFFPSFYRLVPVSPITPCFTWIISESYNPVPCSWNYCTWHLHEPDPHKRKRLRGNSSSSFGFFFSQQNSAEIRITLFLLTCCCHIGVMTTDFSSFSSTSESPDHHYNSNVKSELHVHSNYSQGPEKAFT